MDENTCRARAARSQLDDRQFVLRRVPPRLERKRLDGRAVHVGVRQGEEQAAVEVSGRESVATQEAFVDVDDRAARQLAR